MSIQSIGDLIDIPSKADVEKYAQMSYRERRQVIIDIENNIPGNLNEEDGFNCDECKNRGYIWKLNDDDMDTRVECKCKSTRATLRRARESGLGDILTDCTFEKFVPTEEWQFDIKNKAIDFCKNPDAKWFFIGGQPGSGKTHICTAIAGYYIKKRYDVKYMLWCEDSKRLKALINEPEYQSDLNKYKDVPVLYIDDFLKTQHGELPTKGDINIAFELINHRLMNPDLITIISSEKTLSDILTYDEATMSRIYQKTGIYKINIAKDIGKNYRLKE